MKDFFNGFPLKCSHLVNFEATKMLFTSKWGRISPAIQWYQNKCSNYGTLSYTTTLFEKKCIFIFTPICRPTVQCYHEICQLDLSIELYFFFLSYLFSINRLWPYNSKRITHISHYICPKQELINKLNQYTDRDYWEKWW